MKRYINLIIYLTGVAIAVSNFIIGQRRCTVVGLLIIIFGILNSKINKVRLIIPKTIILSTMFWILRFSLISIPIALNFYQFLITKIVIFFILLFFFLFRFSRYPFKFYKNQIFTIFLITNLFFDYFITYQFDQKTFTNPFIYITLIPIFFIFLANDKISYVSEQSSTTNPQGFSRFPSGNHGHSQLRQKYSY